MSHGIEKDDKMVWTNERPWHGLGEQRDRLMTAHEVWAATMDWDLEAWGKQAVDPTGGGAPIDLPASQAIVRTDIRNVVGEVGGDYTIVQNTELRDLADSLVHGEARFETGGSLFSGKKVWFAAKLGDGITIRRLDGADDPLETYLTLSSRHDGAGSVLAMTGNIRTVCNNTLTWATHATKNKYAMRHTANVAERMEGVAKALRMHFEWLGDFATEAQELAEQRMSGDAMRDFAASVISDITGTFGEVTAALKERGRSERTIERIVDETETATMLFTDGTGNTGETKWDGMNAIVEFLDHHKKRARRGREMQDRLDARMDDIWWGETARRKDRAIKLLRR